MVLQQQMIVAVLSINNANANYCDSEVVLIRKNVNKYDGGNVHFMQSNIKNGCEKHTVLILGDFRTRGCANKIKDTLNKNVVTHFVKPGSHIPTLRVSAKGTIENLTKNDKILF
jgi:hypothetical protein